MIPIDKKGYQMLIRCPHCQTKNRVPEARVDEPLQCGRCHEPIFEGHVVDMSEDDWSGLAQHSKRLMLIDFWADWCGPCKMMAPTLTQVASQLPQIRFVKINTDEAPQLSARLAIRSIPSLLLWRDGVEIDRRSGAMPLNALKSWLDAYVP